jgi:MFS family permease
MRPRLFGASVLRDLTRALTHQGFRFYISGQFISLIGTWMQFAAVSWLVYRLTGSSVDLGIVSFAGHFPVFALAILGGAAADLVDKRKLLIITQAAAMVQAAVLAALTLTGTVAVWHVVALSACLGVVNALDMPLRQSFLVELVDREHLHNAIALNSSMFNAARVLGPSVAGFMVARFGEGVCFLVNAVSFAAVIACLTRIRQNRIQPPGRESGFARHLGEGLRHAAKTPKVGSLLLLVGAISLLGASSLVLMPVFAGHVFDSGPLGLGVLMAAAGTGSLAGALTLAARPSPAGLNPWLIKAACAFALGLIGFALSPSFWLALVLLVPSGFGMVAFMAAANTRLQMLVPDRLRGRIMSLFSMMLIGMSPFGSLLCGLLSDALGPRPAVVLSGLGCLVAVGLYAKTSSRWKDPEPGCGRDPRTRPEPEMEDAGGPPLL